MPKLSPVSSPARRAGRTATARATPPAGKTRRGRAGNGAAARPVRLALLRAFELHCGDQEIVLPMSAQRLLAFLALREGPVHRIHVAGTLWIDTNEERAGANLRTALWRLRQVPAEVVESASTHIRLAPSVEVDVREALAIAERLLDPAAGWAGADLAAATLSADLLPDWYDDWVLLEQERFRQIRLHALEALCERLVEAGRFGPAIDAGLAAVAGEPLRESAQRVLISAYLAEGNRGEAIRQYERYRTLLRESLALEPSAAIDDLFVSLRDRLA
ncbi:MAG TPA: BTAD domain-containing putative transcriptional regulator [Gaiellaceae bacterium]|jgi:DNA-binding SARP family transcriptional activator|nr:BTAD domain-containing putative transcriptional regulator [Gaiellaceae bacterium]